jgi:hypothetical protein
MNKLKALVNRSGNFNSSVPVSAAMFSKNMSFFMERRFLFRFLSWTLETMQSSLVIFLFSQAVFQGMPRAIISGQNSFQSLAVVAFVLRRVAIQQISYREWRLKFSLIMVSSQY